MHQNPERIRFPSGAKAARPEPGAHVGSRYTTRCTPVMTSTAMSFVSPGVPLPAVSRWNTIVWPSGDQVGR
jgi:hypothetical protein